jgi:hypothetical protein
LPPIELGLTVTDVITGAVVSLTVTLVVPDTEFPESSVAVIVTVWLPIGNCVPAAGFWTSVTSRSQLSLTEHIRNTSGVPPIPLAPAVTVTGAAGVRTGAVLSTTWKTVVQVL